MDRKLAVLFVVTACVLLSGVVVADTGDRLEVSGTEQIIIEYSIDDRHEFPLFGEPDPVIKITSARNDSVRYRYPQSPAGTITVNKGWSNQYYITLLERDCPSDCSELGLFGRLFGGDEEIATETWTIDPESEGEHGGSLSSSAVG